MIQAKFCLNVCEENQLDNKTLMFRRSSCARTTFCAAHSIQMTLLKPRLAQLRWNDDVTVRCMVIAESVALCLL